METAGKSSGIGARNGTLLVRTLSALILAPVALGAVYAGGALFAGVVAFAAIIMTFEWARMVEGRDFTPAFYGLAGAGAAAFALAAAGFYLPAYGVCAVGAIVGAALSLRASRRTAWIAFAGAYILAPSVALIWLRNDFENGRAITLMLFLIVWAADTGGYFGGRLVGGPKMSPAVSPAKTWAGAVGGLIMGGAAGFAAARWIYGDGPLVFYALVGGALGVSSILGDVAGSAFKRNFGVKDTSGFIPGHGGALDRLDGMIFATTAMTLTLFLHMLYGRLLG